MIWFFSAADSVEEGEVGDDEELDEDEDEEEELNGFGKEGNDILGRLESVVLGRWQFGMERY